MAMACAREGKSFVELDRARWAIDLLVTSGGANGSIVGTWTTVFKDIASESTKLPTGVLQINQPALFAHRIYTCKHSVCCDIFEVELLKYLPKPV
jgi:hypothetical protein